MSFPPLLYLTVFSISLPFLAGLVRFRLLAREVKFFVVLFAFHTAITVIQMVLGARGINNLWTSHIYNVVEVFITLWVFSVWVGREPNRRLLRGIAIGYVVFWFLLKLGLERFDLPTLYSTPLSRVILLAATLHILFVLATTAPRPLLRDPRFWIATSFLFASSGSLMFYALRPVIYQMPMESLFQVFSVHWGVMIISNLICTVGFLCKPLSPSSGGQLELAR